MRMLRPVGAVLASLLVVSSYATYQEPQEQAGMVVGGVLGGVLASEIFGGGGYGRGHHRGSYPAPTSPGPR